MLQVFVVGTGRSGTMTLANFLSTPPGCRVIHEHTPFLLGELTAYLTRRMTQPELVALLRATRSPAALGGERLSGEANQRLSFVLPELVEAFPGARIVWLVRDGRTAVASMWHRQWYDRREAKERPPGVQDWVKHRLRADLVGDLSPEEWQALDAFGRCCWYWAYTNRVIERELAKLSVPTFHLRIEDLPARTAELAAFVDLAGELTAEVPRSNAATGGRPLPWRAWSPAQREVFRKLCGSGMDRHYPGWELPAQWDIGAALSLGWYRLWTTVVGRTRPLVRVPLGLVRRVRSAS